MNDEQRITVCKTSVDQIYAMLRSTPNAWRSYLSLARSVITNIESTTFMSRPTRTAEQIWLVAGLQRLISSNDDSNDTGDIAIWCSRQWLTIHEREPTNVAALQGIGQGWMLRAQPALIRINRQELSSSSSGGSSGPSALSSGCNKAEAHRRSSSAAAEAERRVGTADYVEARGYLQPATEYLDRAVAAAEAQQILSGDLLTSAAEAYLSLGNTSSPRRNEQYFRRAVQHLGATTAVPDFRLNRYLQQYLDEYGRLLD